MKGFVKFLCVFLPVISVCECYNILLVFHIPGRSLSILGEAFVRNLIDDGHEVTYITPFPMKFKPKTNYREIDMSDALDKLISTNSDLFNATYLMDNKQLLGDNKFLQLFGFDFAKNTFENKKVLDFLQENQNFDLVIADFYESELFAGLAALYQCPLIWASSMPVDWVSSKLVSEPTNPAYSTDIVTPNTPPLSFKQRVEELWVQIYATFVEKYIIRPKEIEVYYRILGPLFEKKGIQMPDFEDIAYNASLLFSYSHHAIRNMPSIPQSIKLIGGLHIDDPVKPLPEDLQNIMDNARDGVIYFSMGSVWNCATMPDDIKKQLVQDFSKLKQTIIWKYEADDLKNLPKNVHIVKWAPQQSILAHKNCILFITHGGWFSSSEVIHFGVPSIGIPVYMDQYVNTNRAVANGYGLKVGLTRNLANDLKDAVNEMLSNPRYAQKVKEISEIYHDRTTSPSVELKHWTRHVVRTNGALHLRSPALQLYFYQRMYLDLLATIVLVYIVLKYAIIKIILAKSVEVKKKQKNN